MGGVMKPTEVSSLQKANAILQQWNRQHYRAALLVVVPVLAGFVLAECAPPVPGSIGMAVGPALGLTLGLALIPADFRSRSGSLTPAICLVAAMWIAALCIAVVSFIGRP